jgi:hypothetical protein
MQQYGFTYLIGYDWQAPAAPWDMLFADGSSKLLVVKAKGKSRLAAQQQGKKLAEALRSTHPECKVYAAVWSPEKCTPWAWVRGMERPKKANSSSSPAAAATVAASCSK